MSLDAVFTLKLDERLRDDFMAEAAAAVEAVVAAGEREGIAFQLNARTDAFVRGGDKPLDAKIEDAITRGRAYLDAGAALVFVPGVLNREVTERLVAGLGAGRMSVIGLPGALPAAEYEALGVARISYGPTTQRHALRALRDLATDLYADGVIPEDTGAVMTPAMMLVMLPYFGVVFFNDNPLVMTILSYVPFSAPVGMPVRLFFGEAQWWEPLISLAVLAAAAAVVVLVASRIYANSLLRMGSRVPLREALRSAG